LMEGWPKYHVGVARSGSLVVRYETTDPDSIRREAQRLREMGFEEGVHFTVKMPEEGRDGNVYVRREGLERAAWLSVHGSGRQRELAAQFIEYISREGRGGGQGGLQKGQRDYRGGQDERFPNAEGLREGGRNERQEIRGEGDRRRSR
jgi:hypothetical protein